MSMDDPTWKIPPQFQPTPERYSFDLDNSLRALVSLKSIVPPDAFTAGILGTERSGSGVLIREDGLVLTIGYLITEAETVWLTTIEGAVVPAHVVGIDHSSGLGLVQALGRLRLPALELGDSTAVDLGQSLLFAAAGGRQHAVRTHVSGRDAFAGNWEYLLERPIFTVPAHPFWGGGGVIGENGMLLGIGSLVLQHAEADGRETEMNMAVPVDLLAPVFEDLLRFGRPSGPVRPWVGLYCAERDDEVVVQNVIPGGPAATAELQRGDRIHAVGGHEVTDLAEFWRHLWASGPAGTVIPLTIERGRTTLELAIRSADRVTLLRGPKLH
jgi:S1-C subfamily serine protease